MNPLKKNYSTSSEQLGKLILEFKKKYLYAGLILFIFGILTVVGAALPEEEFYQGMFLGMSLYNFTLSMLCFSLGIKPDS